MNTLISTLFLVYSASTSVHAQSDECVFVDSITGDYKLDLSELIGVEQTYYDGLYNYTYFVCSNEFDCRNSYGYPSAIASLNQIEANNDCWWLALWDNGATIPSYNPTTEIWSFTYLGSSYYCPPDYDTPRQTVINWHCNPDIIGYTITSAQETGICRYQIDIDSYYACINASAPYCQWYGDDGNGNDILFDLTPLSEITIIGNDATNSELVFAYTPCRNATQCDDLDVMVKLQNVSTSDGCKRYIGIWEDELNGGIPEYGNGIWRFGYNNGETCGELTSELYIYWNCDPNVTLYRVDTADVVEPCLYDIYISSSLACV